MTTTRIKQTATVMATSSRIAALAKIEQCRTDHDTLRIDVAGVNAAVYQLVEYDYGSRQSKTASARVNCCCRMFISYKFN